MKHYMKTLIYCMTALLLSASCAFDTMDYKNEGYQYDGEYPVGKYTTIVRSNGPVTNIDAYTDASVDFVTQVSKGCMFVLNNIITGQPTVQVIGTYKITYSNDNVEKVVFSGNKTTLDRALEVHGVICNGLLTELYFKESMDSDAVGKWIPDSMDASFKKDEVSDAFVNNALKRAVDTLNRYIIGTSEARDKYLEFTSYGFMDSYLRDFEGQIEYYIRPDLNMLNFYIDRTNIKHVFSVFRQNEDFVSLVEQLGLTSIWSIDHSVSLPVYFDVRNDMLNLTLNQSLVSYYLSVGDDALNAIRSYFEEVTYNELYDKIEGTVWAKIITGDNFEEQREVALIIVDALIEGNAEYSFSIYLTPYKE